MILPTAIHLLQVLARQDSPIITQILTQPARPAATVTTLVTLGPTSTAAATHHGPNGLTHVQFGAIIGCVAAVVVMAIAAGICLSSGGKTRNQDAHIYYAETTTTSSSSSGYSKKKRHKHPRRPPPVAERIPGGPKYPTYRAVPVKTATQQQAGRPK